VARSTQAPLHSLSGDWHPPPAPLEAATLAVLVLELAAPPVPLELTTTPIAPNSTELETERQHSEDRLNCLEDCLAKLSAVNRTLIVEYYREEKGLKIEHRKQQAESLGMSLNALRLRASRIRAELAECISRCLQRSE